MANNERKLTYGELLTALQALTPEQLQQQAVWSGEERGGTFNNVYTHDEDWLGDSSDGETWLPRSEVERIQAVHPEEYADAEVCIPIGTVHLMVD